MRFRVEVEGLGGFRVDPTASPSRSRVYNHTSFENSFCEPSLFRVPAMITSFCPDFFLFKGLCFGLRAYAVRLEALRVLGSRNLEEPERGESRISKPGQFHVKRNGISLRNEAPNKFCDR